MKTRRITLVALGTFIGSVGLVFLGVACSGISPTVITTLVPEYEGQVLVISDADQIGTSYADGFVAAGRTVDALTRLSPTSPGGLEVDGTVEVNNSVISWPRAVAVSPDGKYAYVAETRGPFKTRTEEVKDVWTDVPAGSNVTVLELSKPMRIAQTISLAVNPNALSLNFDGTLLAVTSKEVGAELVVAQLVDGLITTHSKHAMQRAVHPGNYNGVAAVEFHPKSNLLAVNMNCTDLSLFEVSAEGKTLTEVSHLPELAKLWSVARWTPDGRFVLLADVGWGKSDLGGATNGPGQLISVRVDGKSATVVSRADVGLSPEGFDVSPDGRIAVTSNMRRTYLPHGMPYALFGSQDRPSLSLVEVNPETGELKTVGDEYGFDGELPEDVAFDASGRFLSVAIFNERHDREPKNGFVELWRVNGNKLERSPSRIPVTRGSHTLKRVPSVRPN